MHAILLKLESRCLGKCQEVWQAYITHCIQNQSVRPLNLHPATIERNLQQRLEALQAW